MSQVLYHFSDRDDISLFRPRAPLRHPQAEPLVYAIDDWHAALYLFPRDCPRIGVWPIETTSAEDREWFHKQTDARILLFIEQSQEVTWRKEPLYRYDVDPAHGFFDTGCIGVWTSRDDVTPLGMTTLSDLPTQAELAGVEVLVVPSLLEQAMQFFDFETREFKTSLHVSMIRSSAIPDWPGESAKPIFGR